MRQFYRSGKINRFKTFPVETASSTPEIFSSVSKQQKKTIKKAKAKHLGFFEGLFLKHLGKRDGKMGLPRKVLDQKWISPKFCEEEDAYAKFMSEAWACTDINNADFNKEIHVLSEDLKIKEALRSSLPPPIEPDKNFLKERKAGETPLTEEQILSRRLREYARQNSGYYEKIRQLDSEISSLRSNIWQLEAIVMQNENATRQLCEKVKRHTRQRLDVYWRGVLCTHPEADSMPPSPSFSICINPEIVYASQHNHSEKNALEIQERKHRLLEAQKEFFVSLDKEVLI